MQDRYVVIITEAEYLSLFEASIGNTGMIYNPVIDANGNWTISSEEVDMTVSPYTYLTSLPLVLFEAPIEMPWF